MAAPVARVQVVLDINPLSTELTVDNDSTMEGTNSWTAGSNTTKGTSTNRLAGTQSMSLTRTTSTGAASALWISATGSASTGRDYLITVHVRPEGGTNRDVTLTITARDSGSSVIGTATVTRTEGSGHLKYGWNGTTWTAILFVVTPPASTSKLGIDISIANCANGEVHDVDVVTCEALGTDLSSRVNSFDATLAGRNDELDRTDSGSARFFFDNTDGKLTPGKTGTGSPYEGNILPRRKIVVLATVASVLYPVWTGYINGWQLHIPSGTDTYAEVEVSASDAFRLETGGDLPAPYTAEVQRLDAPGAYYPFGEGQTAKYAGDLMGGASAPLLDTKYGTGGSAFGADSVLPVTNTGHTADNDSTSLTFNSDIADGKGDAVLLTASSAIAITADWSMSLVFNAGPINAVGFILFEHVVSSFPTDTFSGFKVAFTGTSGTLVVSTAGETVYTSGSNLANQTFHHLGLTFAAADGANGRLRVYLDGTEVANDALSNDATPAGNPTHAWIGGDYRGLLQEIAFPYVGRVQHVAFFPSVLSAGRMSAQYTVAYFGGFAETEGNRVGGLLSLNGWPAADTRIDVGGSDLLGRHWAPSNAHALIQDTAGAGSASVVVDAGGKYMMMNRYRRTNTSSLATFTSSTSTDADPGDYAPVIDDARIENTVEVSRTVGGTIQVSDATSRATYGRRAGPEISLPLYYEAEVKDYAEARLLRRKNPYVRTETVAFTLDNDTLSAQVLNREFGHRITLSNLPVTAPAASGDHFIERIAHSWSGTVWRTQFQLSPVSTTVGIHVAAQLDTGGAVSTLNNASCGLTY